MTNRFARIGAADQSPVTTPRARELVVVVEPEEPLNASLCHILTYAGYRALGVADAATLIDILRASLVDLLMLDAALPVTSGVALCRELRQQPLGRYLPIVMLGEPAPGLRLAALEAGADAFFARPIDPRELLLVVGRLIERCRAGNVVDPISHLPTGQIARMLIETALKVPAWAAVLFELRGLRTVNRQLGYTEGDSILGAVAGLLREVVAAVDERAHLVRIAGARFVAVVPPEAAVDLYSQAMSAFSSLVAEFDSQQPGGVASVRSAGEQPLHLICVWVVGSALATSYPALIDELTDRARAPEPMGRADFPGCPPFRAES